MLWVGKCGSSLGLLEQGGVGASRSGGQDLAGRCSAATTLMSLLRPEIPWSGQSLVWVYPREGRAGLD